MLAHMRILVIGGTAFMGPWVVRDLVAGGHEVTVFHRGKTRSELPAGVRSVQGDRHALQQHIDELRAVKADVVIDMICFSRTDAADLVGVFDGYVARAVVASSCDVYAAFGGLIGIEDAGISGDGALTETSPLRTKRYPFRAQAKGTSDFMYSYDKLDVEETVAASGLKASVVRLPMVYGEGDRQRRLAGYLKQLKESGKIVLGETHAKWKSTRGFVENMGAAMSLIATKPEAAGQVYNVADETVMTEEAFARAVAVSAGAEKEAVKVVEDTDVPAGLRFPGDARHDLVIDSGKVRKGLGYTDRVGLSDGLRRTVVWERSQMAAGK
jgi:nucleoside-diphosphate-sugar epimerase